MNQFIRLIVNQILDDAYIGLNDHPGVGQTHVALCAEELQPLFQIPLSVVINLERTKQKKRENAIKRTYQAMRDGMSVLLSIYISEFQKAERARRRQMYLLVLLSSVNY